MPTPTMPKLPKSSPMPKLGTEPPPPPPPAAKPGKRRRREEG